jgi:hypothetical protein
LREDIGETIITHSYFRIKNSNIIDETASSFYPCAVTIQQNKLVQFYWEIYLHFSLKIVIDLDYVHTVNGRS